jgi:hypothetical protein
LANLLIEWAVRALDPEDQERYSEELRADSDALPAGWRRLRWAIGVRIFMPSKMQAVRHDAPATPPPQREQ